MNLQPSDIDTIEEAGMIDGQPVKLARTTGGFWMGIYNGKIISAGSHPAIVKHTISKMYSNFQPVMCKSENFESDAIVDKHSHFLTDELRKSGHDVYSIQNNKEIEFQVTKNNLKIASVKSTLKNGSLFIDTVSFPKEFSRAIAGAATEKALTSNSKKIEIK